MSRETLTPALSPDEALEHLQPTVELLAWAVRGLEAAQRALEPAPLPEGGPAEQALPPLVELHGALELALVDRLLPALDSLRRELRGLEESGSGRAAGKGSGQSGQSQEFGRPVHLPGPLAGPLSAAIAQLVLLRAGLRVFRTCLGGQGGEGAEGWSLDEERLQAVECILTDHLEPAAEALMRAFTLPPQILRAEYEEAQRSYQRARRRLEERGSGEEAPRSS